MKSILITNGVAARLANHPAVRALSSQMKSVYGRMQRAKSDEPCCGKKKVKSGGLMNIHSHVSSAILSSSEEAKIKIMDILGVDEVRGYPKEKSQYKAIVLAHR